MVYFFTEQYVYSEPGVNPPGWYGLKLSLNITDLKGLTSHPTVMGEKLHTGWGEVVKLLDGLVTAHQRHTVIDVPDPVVQQAVSRDLKDIMRIKLNEAGLKEAGI